MYTATRWLASKGSTHNRTSKCAAKTSAVSQPLVVTVVVGVVLVAAVVGAIGQALAGYSLGGCLISIVVGFVGAVISAWLSQQFALPPIFVVDTGGWSIPIIWSIVSAAIFALIIGLLSRRRVAV